MTCHQFFYQLQLMIGIGDLLSKHCELLFRDSHLDYR